MSRILYVGVMGRTAETGTNQVRRARRSVELTQAQLASAVGVSRQTIVSIEGGQYAPSVFLALRIASHLDATVEDLFAVDEV